MCQVCSCFFNLTPAQDFTENRKLREARLSRCKTPTYSGRVDLGTSVPCHWIILTSIFQLERCEIHNCELKAIGRENCSFDLFMAAKAKLLLVSPCEAMMFELAPEISRQFKWGELSHSVKREIKKSHIWQQNHTVPCSVQLKPAEFSSKPNPDATFRRSTSLEAVVNLEEDLFDGEAKCWCRGRRPVSWVFLKKVKLQVYHLAKAAPWRHPFFATGDHQFEAFEAQNAWLC